MEYKKAFSLPEILIGLIIISVVLAVFAPVMSKKLKKQSSALNAVLDIIKINKDKIIVIIYVLLEHMEILWDYLNAKIA